MSIDSGRLTILHVSDVHATDGELLYGTVDGLARLERVGEYARDAGITPEAVVITGDLAQRGHPGVYPAIAAATERLAHTVGAPVFTVLGNHDDPSASRMLAGHSGAHHRSVMLEHFRLILLDSHTGALGRAQLDWLAAELAEPYRRGTVVALHHAPLGSPLPTLAKQGLRDAGEFLDVVEGSDTLIVLAGHFHHSLSATLRGIPVSVGPSLAYHQVMNAGPDLVSGHDSSMFSLVHLTDDGVRTTSMSLRTPPPLFTSRVGVGVGVGRDLDAVHVSASDLSASDLSAAS